MVTTLVAGGMWLEAGGTRAHLIDRLTQRVQGDLAVLRQLDVSHCGRCRRLRFDHDRRGDQIAVFILIDSDALEREGDALAFFVI